MAVNIHIIIIVLNALHTKRKNLLQELDAVFFFSSRRRHTRCLSDWSSDVCSSDLRSIGGCRARSGDRRCPTDGSSPPQDRARLACRRAARVPRTRPRSCRPRRGQPPPTPPRRSEERRVGKECKSGRWPYQEKQKKD